MTNENISTLMQKYWGIKKVPHDERVKAFLTECESGTVALNGSSYKYYRQGTGPTVILVHGLHSNLGSMVPIALDLIANGFSIVLFDAPAHGEAAGNTTDPIEVRNLIRNISRRLGDVHAIVWHSLGGIWALSAWNDECRAKTVVSIASPASQKFLFDKFVQLHQLSGDVAQAVVTELENRLGKAVWLEFSPSELVKNIGVPGLIIHGRKDEIVPPSHAEQIHRQWSNAQIQVMDGVGHFDVVRSPAVRRLITEYLQAAV